MGTRRLMISRLAATIGIVVAAACTTGASQAETFPSKTVTIIVPFQAGGSTDRVGRVLAQALSDLWKQPVIVENRPGANAAIGMSAGARARPDGHTITLVGHGGMTQVPHVQDMSFDVLKDYEPVTQLMTFDQVLVASKDFAAKVKNISELIALAKAKPDTILNGATSISGALPISILESKMGFKTKQVAYISAAPVLTALSGNQLDIAITDVAVSQPLIAAGTIVALATTGATRTAALPNVPAISETVPGYKAIGWFGFTVPAGTPKAIVEQIYSDTKKVSELPAVKEKLDAPATTIVNSSPSEFAATIKAEWELSRDVIKSMGLKAN